MTPPALLLALALMAADAPPRRPRRSASPCRPARRQEDYPLTAWCYGAMSEYLDIYDRVKPDLRTIDKMFGCSVPNEKEPYADDMAAARQELKVLANAVEAAEKASPNPIAPQGVDAIKQGRSIWSSAEAKTRRELARAWLSWALPDRCDSTARQLATRSALLSPLLKYNSPSQAPASTPEPAPDQAPTSAPSSAPAPEAAPADPNGPVPDSPSPQ